MSEEKPIAPEDTKDEIVELGQDEQGQVAGGVLPHPHSVDSMKRSTEHLKN